MRKYLLLTIVFLSLLPSLAFSWGMIGHRVVGGIAWENLSPKAKKEVSSLLGNENLAMVTTWPDFIRSDPKWDIADTWHYANFPKDAKTYFDVTPSAKGDVVQAIVFFEGQLRNLKLPREKRVQALKFLAHFIGDIHQPLHVGYEDDWGGNKVEVQWFKNSSNLHRVWDEDLINYQQLSYTEYVKNLNKISESEKKTLMDSTVLDWVAQALPLRDQCYKMESTKLGYDYNFQNIEMLNNQLLKAGIHLAGFLNRIFEGRSYSPAQLEQLKKIPLQINLTEVK